MYGKPLIKSDMMSHSLSLICFLLVFFLEAHMLKEMHANNNNTWLWRTLFINGTLCE